ncbi:MAG TPA: homoserine dehydrogenase [Gemmatimonadaceae bacterium]|nr:homoserine dehydrogenase [Gemmatimonadaceae bacterium]
MASPVLRVGLIGHGTVGSAFARALHGDAPRIEQRCGFRLSLARIAVRSPELVRAHRTSGATPIQFTGNAGALAGDASLPIVVEASGAPDAAQWLRSALDRGAAAVTANKRALADDDALLTALAHGEPRLWCEAAVAAAVPIVRALRDSLQGERVLGVRGVINGTSTFVLSRVEAGASPSEAVEEARAAGYAEFDPSADLDGSDAASKVAILATLAWGRPVRRADVRVRGLDATAFAEARAAVAHGLAVRLVARAERDPGSGRVTATVSPVALSASDPLSRATGVQNVVEVRCERAGTLTWFGAGAGGEQTASALLADTISAARAIAPATLRRAS